MPCGNSSNINVSKTFVEVNPAAFASSRFVVTIPSTDYAAGITGGDVIYYGVTAGQYRKAKADDPVSSEVFGIVESRNSISGSIDVITQGSINFPSTGFTATSAGGGAGGLDVYFLSDTDAGKIQPLAPTEVGHIVKPVYQVGAHGGSYTGLVTNYIGYNIGTEIETTIGGFSSGVGSLVFTFGEIDDPSYVKLNQSLPTFLPVVGYEDLFELIQGRYGFVYSIKLKKSTDNSLITPSIAQTLGNAPKLGSANIGYYEDGQQSGPRNDGEYLKNVTEPKDEFAINIAGAYTDEDTGERINYKSWNAIYTETELFQSTFAGIEDVNNGVYVYGEPSAMNSLIENNLYDNDVWYLTTPSLGRNVFYQDLYGIDVGCPSGRKNGLKLGSASANHRFIIDTWGSTIGFPGGGYDILLAEQAKIVGFYLPNITIMNSANLDLNANIKIVDVQNKSMPANSITLGTVFESPINVYMKVKDVGMSSYLPRSVSIEDTLEVPTLKYGAAQIDLETKIDSLISRLETIENRLRIIPP